MGPFAAIAKQWVEKIGTAMDFKKKKFQDDADECMRFFNGPYTFLYGLKYRTQESAFVYTGDDDMPRPSFSMTVNKVAELVQLFGPVLYHRNPIRQVNARKQPMVGLDFFGDPQDPMVQEAFLPLKMQVDQSRAVDKARAQLLEFYLNYTPTALDLKTNSRNAIDEALIKGMGCLWTEVYTPPSGGPKLVGSFYDSVDNLCVDPDMETFQEATWVARRCVHPVWQVEDEYGLKRGTLKGTIESHQAQASVKTNADGDYRRKQGLTNDLICYWKIFSRMGAGARLSGSGHTLGGLEEDKEALDQLLGNYCYLVVCDHVPYPLNLPPELTDSGDTEAIQAATQWPTPYYLDDTFPVTPLGFHWVPREIYPMSHLKPGLGELRFINWAYSFIASKIKTACRDLIAVQKSATEEIKRVILSGGDYELFEIEKAHGTISEVVQFLQHPNFQGDIWKVIQAVEVNFEKRVGLLELMYGQSASQFRSAAEADVKSQQLNIRPDDMANRVEDMMGEVARKEALCARWHLDPADIVPVMGDFGATLWEKLLTTADPAAVIHQLEYRIEAGSAKKPNKERDAANMRDAMQNLFAPMLQFGQATMDFSAVNALLADWAKAHDLDPERYLFKAPPPPEPGPDPAAQEAEMQAQLGQQELQQKDEAHRQGLQHSQEKHKLAMSQAKQKKAAVAANGSK